jgi:hypothetical protein
MGSKRLIKIIITNLLLVLAMSAMAEVPLSIEDIVAKHHEIKLDAGIDYISSENDNILVNQSIALTNPNGSIINIPVDVKYAKQKTDTLVGNFGLKYGITPKTEIYAKTSGLWQKNTNSIDKQSDNLSQINDLAFGIQHQILQEGKNPALIGFAEASIFEKGFENNKIGKSYTIGLSTYKISDPIVFSLATAYRFNLKDSGVKNGNILSVSPSIAFAANNNVSLNVGINWQLRQADKINGKSTLSNQTATALNLGASYAINQNTNINAQVKTSLSGNKQTTLSLLLSHKFGSRSATEILNNKPKVEPIN